MHRLLEKPQIFLPVLSRQFNLGLGIGDKQAKENQTSIDFMALNLVVKSFSGHAKQTSGFRKQPVTKHCIITGATAAGHNSAAKGFNFKRGIQIILWKGDWTYSPSTLRRSSVRHQLI